MRRLLQAWFLLRASVQVLIKGPLPAYRVDPRIKEQIHGIIDDACATESAVDCDFLSDLRRMQHFHGIWTSVAIQLGVTPQHVRHVAMGLSTSGRVLIALKAEYERIKREAEHAA